MSIISTIASSAGDLVEALPELPNPDPAAPAEVQGPVSRVIAMVKWIALAACVLAIVSLGLVAGLAQASGHGSRAAEMKEQFGAAIVGAVAVTAGASILTFIIG